MAERRVSLEDWPRLTRFYGITPSELARTPNAILRIYAEQLPSLHAEETLLGFTTSDLPYAEKGDRKRIYRTFERYVEQPEPEQVDVRTESGAAVAASLGIVLDIPEVESSQEA